MNYATRKIDLKRSFLSLKVLLFRIRALNILQNLSKNAYLLKNACLLKNI